MCSKAFRALTATAIILAATMLTGQTQTEQTRGTRLKIENLRPDR